MGIFDQKPEGANTFTWRQDAKKEEEKAKQFGGFRGVDHLRDENLSNATIADTMAALKGKKSDKFF